MWLWLRWLPLRFAAYSGYVEFANATNATAVTPVGTFTNHIPAGWYLDPATKAVFRVPEANLTLLTYVASLSEQLKALKAELEKSRADASQTPRSSPSWRPSSRPWRRRGGPLRRPCGRGSLKRRRSRPTCAPPRPRTSGSGHSWHSSRPKTTSSRPNSPP
jgi:hypothetical protein